MAAATAAGPALSTEAVARAVDHCSALSEEARTSLRYSLLGPSQVPDQRLCNITERLLTELQTPFLASRVAALASLERQYFSTFFRLHLGINFSRWRRNVRVAAAIHLLTVEGMSITAVAHGVGYRTSSEFGRALRKSTGLSPKRLLGTTAVTSTPAVSTGAGSMVHAAGAARG